MELARRTSQLTPPESVIKMLLADKRSAQTRRAYAADLMDFFQGDPEPELLQQFLSQDTGQMAYTLTQYKADLLKRGMSEATVNRRLAAVKSLIKFARRLGQCDVDPRGLVDAEKVTPYRDTTGISVVAAGKLLAQPDTSTLKGRRDLAMLLLLVENGLRRAELCALDVPDFEPDNGEVWRIRILGKGKGTQKESAVVSSQATAAILEYLETDGRIGATSGPLFLSCDRRGQRTRLTPAGLYFLVSGYGQKAGVGKRLSPHKLRHTAITQAAILANGNLIAVQDLSRHAQTSTVQRYIDNVQNRQGELTDRLSALFAAARNAG